MEFLIVSDSHGRIDRLAQITEACSACPPDRILFLGDGINDCGALSRMSGKEVLAVSGNCDILSPEPPERITQAEDKKILMLHGHTRGVKHGLKRLEYRAKEVGADIVLYGHTHERDCHVSGGVWFFNPGSVGFPSGGGPSFGRLTVKNGIVSFSFGEL